MQIYIISRIISFGVLFSLTLNSCILSEGLRSKDLISPNIVEATTTLDNDKLEESFRSPLTLPSDLSKESAIPLDNGQHQILEEDPWVKEEISNLSLMFYPQSGSPSWLPNFSRPNDACNWMGIAGQVFDNEGNAVQSLIVEIGGVLEDMHISLFTLTGIAPAYGPGGYEIEISNQPVNSHLSLWIRLLDLDGESLSHPIYFDTFADCSRNLILMNFVSNAEIPWGIYHYLPVILINYSP
jgi:hypothetical protein